MQQFLAWNSGLFLGVMAFIGFLSACGMSDERRAEKIEELKRPRVKNVINQVCKTQDKVVVLLEAVEEKKALVLYDTSYKIALDCRLRREFSAVPKNQISGGFDYSNTEYATGSLPIPVQAIKIGLVDPEKYKSLGDLRPPAGTFMLFSFGHRHFPMRQSDCEYFNGKSPWCVHYFWIPETKLAAKLSFNASSHAHYPMPSAGPIRPDKSPWAYYPEDEWPNLYAQTERFIKNLIVE